MHPPESLMVCVVSGCLVELIANNSMNKENCYKYSNVECFKVFSAAYMDEDVSSWQTPLGQNVL